MGWGGRTSKRGGGGGVERETTTSGCMCAVFQFFDFHQLQFPNFHHQSHSLHQDDLTIPKGVNAPRNSLDSSARTSLSSTTTKEEESLNSPILKIQQIKTSGGGTTSDSSGGSPATKTPSLVARLMGLDLLPESQSPSSTSTLTPKPHHASSKPHLNIHSLRSHHQPQSNGGAGTRSLPETPRVSASRISDVDHHHRLSLQINKENNIAVGEEIEFARLSSFRRKELLKSIIADHESGKSPSHYARQIVKHVRETVSRKFGLVDITNTTRNDRDLLNHQLKSKQVSSSLACSPRLRLSESKTTTKPTTTSSPTLTKTSSKEQVQVLPPKPNSVNVQGKPKPQTLQEQKSEATTIPQRRKLVEDGIYCPAKLKKQEEAFVRPSTAPARAHQQCKKTQLISNNLLNLNNVPTLLPIKKDPSSPATKLPPKHLSSSTSQQLQSQNKQDQATSSSSSHVRGKNDDVVPNGLAAVRTTGGAGVGITVELRQYITRILSRTGIDKDTQVSFTNWFSPSHPLDPSIFFHLENSFTATNHHPSQLGLRCNRKLLFHVVDEILVEILRPYLNLKSWLTSSNNVVTTFGHKGSKLIEIVCFKIQSFPGADCRVLEDIDAIIDKDLPEPKAHSAITTAFEDEGEGIVRAIESDILDTLVNETAMCLWFNLNCPETTREGCMGAEVHES